MINGKILLTGGTGSLGRAILARARAERWDCQITVFSRTEAKQAEVKAEYPEHTYVLGDVRIQEDIEAAIRGHDTVIHAAAYKQVPAAEVNTRVAIGVNVIGSLNVLKAATEYGIDRLIGISTDKACAPINCYGQTKSLMEKAFQDEAAKATTKINLVRYGNVLGSTGSVVPLFRRQAQETGILTLTDTRMTRFWLTLTDAVDLVIHGLRERETGTIIVPKADAADMVTLAFAISPRAALKDIGIRAGEKIHEALLHRGESMHAEDIGRHFRIWPAYTGHHGNLEDGFEYTSNRAPQLDSETLRKMITECDDHMGAGG